MFDKREPQSDRPKVALPVNAGPDQCGTCWVMPGVEHELSCKEVSPELSLAYLGITAGTN